MKLNLFFKIWSVLYGSFGLGLFLIPSLFMSQYGVALNDTGVLMARILGSSLTASAILFFLNRNVSTDGKSQLNILRTNLVYNILDTPVVLMAVLNGTMNAMGWIPVVLHIFLACSFGYFAFKKQ